ncbi:MAG: helix-turn-helix domain-containing protein [Vicinamibacterales bacterium]
MSDRLLREAEVCARLGISKNTVRKRIDEGLVPQHCATGPRRWRESEIDRCIKSWTLTKEAGVQRRQLRAVVDVTRHASRTA